MSKYIKVGSSSGSSGSSTFDGLSDKASVDLPGINTPLANALSGKASTADVTNHTSNTTNPHAVTKTQVGLSNVDNTSDTNKPVSTATQTALNAKEGTSNKKTDVDANKTSNVFFPSVKAVFDWVSGLFVKGAASSTDNAIAVFDGTTGKSVKNSGITVAGTTVVGATNILTDKIAMNGTYHLNTQWTSGITVGADGQNKFLLGYSPSFFGGSALLCGADSTLASFAPVSITGTSVTIGNHSSLKALVVDSVAGLRITALAPIKISSTLLDNVGSSGADGQVLKKVGGLVIWANP